MVYPLRENVQHQYDRENLQEKPMIGLWVWRRHLREADLNDGSFFAVCVRRLKGQPIEL